MLLFVVLTCFVVSTGVFAQNNVVFDNGTISFAPVPTSTGSFSPVTYDDRGLGGYYGMANGFVDVVRSGSLPYGESTSCGHGYLDRRRYLRLVCPIN